MSYLRGEGGLNGSIVPAFPVYGFTVGLLGQLSTFVTFGFVCWCGATYVPSLVTWP